MKDINFIISEFGIKSGYIKYKKIRRRTYKRYIQKYIRQKEYLYFKKLIPTFLRNLKSYAEH